MCVVLPFEEECLYATVVGCLMGEQMVLELLDIKVEITMLDNSKMISRGHGAFDEYLGSDIIWVR